MKLEILKKNIKQWHCTKGAHIIDIIPYKVGSRNPLCKAGETADAFEVFIHKNLGPHENQWAVCRKETFNRECPICEYIDRQSKEDKDGFKNLWPKQYTLYNIICYDTAEDNGKGVQVWLVPWFHMEHALSKLVIDKHPKTVFSDPKNGTSILFFVDHRHFDLFQVFQDHQFKKRNYFIDEETIEGAYCLDEIIKIPSYAKVNRLFLDSPIMHQSPVKNLTKEVKLLIETLKNKKVI